MLYEQSIDNCFAEAIGKGGLERSDFDAALTETAAAMAALRRHHEQGSLALLALPGRGDDLASLGALAERLRADFSDVVILGAGGSSLGGQALGALAPGPVVGAPRLHFPDNLDPRGFARLLDGLDLAATCMIAISKSGTTAETLAQTLAAMAACVDAGLGERLDRHFLFVTEPADNPLRRLGARHGIEVLDHDPGLGGRYSVLSVVGLLPALLRGLDAGALRAGARGVLETVLGAAGGEGVAPAEGAALAVAFARGGRIAASVLMPYDGRLERFAMWYRQLWAESLGKGGEGSLPVAALGPRDQHSQLQLYLDGPGDKLFTLITPDTAGAGPAIDTSLAADPTLDYLTGRTIGDVVAAEARATAEALAARGRPVRLIRVARLDEETMGALMMHFMLETIIAGHLLAVDPFDQPAVEDGKRLTRQYLARE